MARNPCWLLKNKELACIWKWNEENERSSWCRAWSHHAQKLKSTEGMRGLWKRNSVGKTTE